MSEKTIRFEVTEQELELLQIGICSEAMHKKQYTLGFDSRPYDELINKLEMLRSGYNRLLIPFIVEYLLDDKFETCVCVAETAEEAKKCVEDFRKEYSLDYKFLNIREMATGEIICS